MTSPQTQKKSNYSSLKMMLTQVQQRDANPYINHEFQDYGIELAKKLNDMQHRALYIKLAKTHPRTVLDSAYGFVADYPNAQNKGKLFMWKLKQIKLKTMEVNNKV